MAEEDVRGSPGPCVAVVGVGNTLFGDDGIGYCIVEALNALEAAHQGRLRLEALERLTPGSIDVLDGCGYAVFVDAYHPDAMPHGADVAIVEVDPSRLEPLDASVYIEGLDPHGVDPLGLVVLARSAGVFGGKAWIVGVRASRVEFARGLSEDALGRVAKAVEALQAILGRLGLRLDPSPGAVAEWVRRHCLGSL